MVVNVEYPSSIHEFLYTIGDLIVIAGAGWKFKTTTDDLLTLGFQKSIQAMVRNFVFFLSL